MFLERKAVLRVDHLFSRAHRNQYTCVASLIVQNVVGDEAFTMFY
jgi:hypothetical protein